MSLPAWQARMADQGPPVFGGGGDDGVDVFAVQELAVVLQADAAVVLGGLHNPGKVHVGESDEAKPALGDGQRHQLVAATADADYGHADAVIGPRRGQQAGRNDVRGRDGSPRRRCAEKLRRVMHVREYIVLKLLFNGVE